MRTFLKKHAALLTMIVFVVGPVVFLLLGKNSNKKAQKQPLTMKPLERQTGGFTPLIKKKSEEIKQKEPLESQENFAPKVGFLAPDFSLKNLNDQTVALNDFQGKNLLLVFWATTCGWCAAEKDDLVRFTNEQKEKIEVVAIVNEPKEVVLKYVKKEGINFAILLDKERATFDKYQTLGTPAHFLIDKNGKVTDWRPGYTAYDGLLWMLKTLEK